MKLDVRAWPGLELIAPVSEGHRNVVWRARYGETTVAVRQSRRSRPSLDWELDLLAYLARHAMWVPEVIETASGERHVDGVVVQQWLDGHPPESTADWKLVANALQSIHLLMGSYPQRPGCCSVLELESSRRSVDADLDQVPADVSALVTSVFADFAGVPTAVIHGDPMDANIRIGADGQVGFLDWDESRVDLVWHDLSNLGVQVLEAADHTRALRLSNCWEAVNAWTVEPEYARTRLAQVSGEP